MKILIDNGHGIDTKGKRSPCGTLLEWQYTRNIAQRIENELKSKGYDVERIVTEDKDIPLGDRTKRINTQCDKYGKDNVFVISIHVNAAKNGEWANGRGWSAYTSKGKTKSDILATLLYEEAIKNFVGYRVRKDYSDGDADWEENFYILKQTKCVAVLTENFFMDNKEDMAYLLSDIGQENIVKTHVDAVIKYVNL